MPSRTRTLTLSIASMAAVMSLALSTPNATAAPPDQEPGSPSTSIQTTSPAADPPPTSAQPETPATEPTAPTSSAPATQQAPSSNETAPPTTSEAPSSTTPTPSTTTPSTAKPQARAAVAAGCQTYPPTSYQVCGVIRDKYNQMNGPNSFLLYPKSNELTNPGNTGKRSEFVGGNIYWSTATGAHPVAHDFLTKWGQYGYEGGFLKYPTTDEIRLGVGVDGRRQEFQGGYLYFDFPSGTHNVQGAILDKYKALGGPGSYLGFPTGDETVTPDGKGRYNTFQNGSLYWSSASGAHAVNGPILDQWSADGYEGGKWGYPIGDQIINKSADTITQKFQRGSMTVGNLGLLQVPASGNVVECNFLTKADNPHISTFDPNLPKSAQGKGYWQNVDCPADYVADTTAQLQSQQLNNPQQYLDVGEPTTQYNQPGYGLSRDKAIAHYDCPEDDPSHKYLYRVIVDVDIVGHPDTPNKGISNTEILDCRPDFVDPF